MALLAAAGFDNLAADGASVDAILSGGDWLSSDGVLQETTAANVRTGRGSVKIPNTASGGLYYRSPADQGTLIFGMGWQSDWGAPAVKTIFWFQYNDGGGSTDQVTIGVDTNNALVVKNGDGTVLGTSAIQTITLLNHHFIEAKITAHATAGVVVVRVDRDEVLNLTGVQTIKTGEPNTVNQVRYVVSPTSTYHLDDWYCCDTNGSVNNDFLGGETRDWSLLPDGAGDATEWTVSGAAANYLAVDEEVPDEDATHNAASVAAKKDLFTLEGPLAGITTIYGVRGVVRARREEGGTGNLRIVIKLGGTELESDVLTLDTTYKNYSWIFETKPGGGGWAPADVAALQIGYKYV